MTVMQSTPIRPCCACGGNIESHTGCLTFPWRQIRHKGGRIEPRMWHYTCATEEGYDIDVSALTTSTASDLLKGKQWSDRVELSEA